MSSTNQDSHEGVYQELKEQPSSPQETTWYCVIYEEELPTSHFSKNHTLTLENYQFIQTVMEGQPRIIDTNQPPTNDDEESHSFDPDNLMLIHLLCESGVEIPQESKSSFTSDKLRISDQAFRFLERRFERYYKKELMEKMEEHVINVKSSVWEFAKNWLIVFGMAFVIVAFLLLSALPIWSIEAYNERQQNIANNATNIRLEKWNYANSVYFCLVTFTTIGYGDFYPDTVGGRVYIAIFGLIGIAIMGIMLVVVGRTTTGSAKAVLLWITLTLYKIIRCCTPGNRKYVLTKKDRLYRFLSHPLTQFSYYSIFWVCYVLICAAIFMAIEQWQYNDSCWYCFVTLATIGYGDFYPKTGGGKIFFMFFAIIGLGFEAVMIGLLSEVVMLALASIKAKFKQWCKCGCCGKSDK